MLDLLVEGVGANFLTPFLLSTCTATMPPALPLLRRKSSSVRLTLPSLKAWGFSFLRESLESTELNPDTFLDLKTAQRAFLG